MPQFGMMDRGTAASRRDLVAGRTQGTTLREIGEGGACPSATDTSPVVLAEAQALVPSHARPQGRRGHIPAAASISWQTKPPRPLLHHFNPTNCDPHGVQVARGSHQMLGTSPLSRMAWSLVTSDRPRVLAVATMKRSQGSARTLTPKRRLRERAGWRAQSPPTSDRGGQEAIQRCCRPIGWPASAPHAGGSQGGRPSVSAGRRGCSRRGLRPARDRCARSLPCPHLSAPQRRLIPTNRWPISDRSQNHPPTQANHFDSQHHSVAQAAFKTSSSPKHLHHRNPTRVRCAERRHVRPQ